MKLKQTLHNISITVGLLLLPLIALLPSTPISAQSKCGGVDTAIITCNNNQASGDVEDTGLWQLLIMAINILTAGVGVLALAGIVYGAVLYTSAGGKPEQIKKATTVFTNVVIGIICFAGMWAFLNFIIPGGVF